MAVVLVMAYQRPVKIEGIFNVQGTWSCSENLVSKLSHLMGGDLERVNLFLFSLWLRVHWLC